MAIKIGECCRGRVTRIAAYGAFVALEMEGTAVSGMVHISELSPGYVRDTSDCVTVGDEIRVKVLSVDARGRLALSRRQAMTEAEQAAERAAMDAARHRGRQQKSVPASAGRTVPTEAAPHVRGGMQTASPSSDGDFEDMMRRFRSASEEKLGDLRRSADGRRTRRKR